MTLRRWYGHGVRARRPLTAGGTSAGDGRPARVRCAGGLPACMLPVAYPLG